MTRFHSLLACACALTAALAARADAAKYQTNIVPARNQTAKPFRCFGAEPAQAKLRVLYIGNSITRHGPSAKLGWTNDCGMAASTIDRDYVHVHAAMVQKREPAAAFALLNAYAKFETSFMKPEWKPEAHFAEARDFKPDVVFIFFGANVPQDYIRDPKSAARSFGDALEQLRAYLDTGKTRFFFCEGFYVRPGLDADKKAVAARHGDTFVRMDDIRQRDDTHGRFNHPNDTGMRLIAERFAEVML